MISPKERVPAKLKPIVVGAPICVGDISFVCSLFSCLFSSFLCRLPVLLRNMQYFFQLIIDCLVTFLTVSMFPYSLRLCLTKCLMRLARAHPTLFCASLPDPACTRRPQDRAGMCPTNGVSPLDNMRTLEHYLNDMVRGTAGAGGDHGKGTAPLGRISPGGRRD